MDYKLKNRDGVETTYAKDKIKIPAATGDSMVVFTQGKAQAEKTVDINANGAFTVEPDAGFAFIKKVSGTVAVPIREPDLQEKTLHIGSNGKASVSPDAGKDGLSKVDIIVAVPTPAPTLQKKSISITANGTGSVLPDAGKDGLSEVDYTVDVPASTPILQEKTVTITENGTTEVTPDSGQDGLSKVTVDVDVGVSTNSAPKSLNYEGINFVSWDGTVVETWTLTQLQNATKLPDLPNAPRAYMAPCISQGTYYPTVGMLVEGGFSIDLAYDLIKSMTTQCFGWNSTLADLKAANMPAVVGVVFEARKTFDMGDLGTATSVPIQRMPMAVVLEVPDNTTISLTKIDYEILDDGQGNHKPSSLSYAAGGEYVLYLRYAKVGPSSGYAVSEEMRPYVKSIICAAYFGDPRNYVGCATFSTNPPWALCPNIKCISLSPNCTSAGFQVTEGCMSLETVSFPVKLYATSAEQKLSMEAFFYNSDDAQYAQYAQYARRLKFVCMPPASIIGAVSDWNAVAGAEAICITTNPGAISSAPATSSASVYAFVQMRLVDLSHCAEMVPYPFYLGNASSGDKGPLFDVSNAKGWNACKIKVPAALLDQYKAAEGWSDYANYIVGV